MEKIARKSDIEYGVTDPGPYSTDPDPDDEKKRSWWNITLVEQKIKPTFFFRRQEKYINEIRNDNGPSTLSNFLYDIIK